MNRFPYTAEYWELAAAPNPNDPAFYQLKKTVKIRMNADGSGRLFVYAKEGDLLKNGRIRNVKDAAGTLVFNRDYEITLQEPIFGMMYTREYFRYWTIEVV